MTDLRKAAEQALEILDMCFYDEEDEVYCLGGWHQEKFMDAREALRQALAQPVDAVNISTERVDETVKSEQEPFEYWNAVEGWVKIDEVREHFQTVGCGTIYKATGEGRSPLYTAPPKREWVGLTDDELEDLEFASVDKKYGHLDVRVLSRAIEQQLKEKNGG